MLAGALTVKHVEKSGHESVTQALSVCYEPGSENAGHSDNQVIAFGVPQPVSDECNRYNSGTVYVMNDAGATVAKYPLSDY